ncbi:MAG: IMP cyclohydrolase [Mailhella sp.]|nr:IMP cyclohydrolase [Mailhella sp.]
MSDLKKMYSRIVKDDFPDEVTITLGSETLRYEKRTWNVADEIRGLRYGENPDQPAALYALRSGSFAAGSREWRAPGQGIISEITEDQMLQFGKHPGKTNLTDVDNACNILQYLARKPAATILKHNNPCGAAWAGSIEDALTKAFWSDRIAAFGGAVVLNRPLTKAAAELIASQYFEVVAAPDFEEGTREIIASRKNLRIMHLPGLGRLDEYKGKPWLDIKSLMDGGLILQQSFVNRILDASDFLPAEAEDKSGVMHVTRKPSEQELDDLLFAWAVEAGVTSNSVIFVRDGATVGIGTGEQDRVGCVELTIHKAYTKYADTLIYSRHQKSLYEWQLKALNDPAAAEELTEITRLTAEAKGGLVGTALISDGFFPFRDGVDTAAAQGVKAIAQPGGSIRDPEVIDACNEAGIAMVFTGQRSFKH